MPNPPMIKITGTSGRMSAQAQFRSKPAATKAIAISSSRSVQDLKGAPFN